MERIYILITLFFTGAAIMVLELLGSRIIGPYYGVSLYVWSSMITVTLIALAAGYWLGGLAADRGAKANDLYRFVFLAGLFMLFITLISGPVLKATSKLGIRGGALLSSFVLFTVPLLLLGMVTPYAVKLLTKEFKILGRTAGNLYAISTVGGFAGTVLTGFILIPNLGVKKIIYLQSFILVLLYGGWHLLGKRYFRGSLVLPVLLISVVNLFAKPQFSSGKEGKVIYKAESLYGQIKVMDKGDQRWLLIDGVGHTAVYRKNGESILPYTYYMELLPYLNPEADTALIVGLGGGSISRALSEYGIKVESVELDPKVIDIARKYFGFKGNCVTGDGRAYIRSSNKKFDFVIFDAYSSDVIPVHLTTIEVFKETEKVLKKEGILAVNCVGFAKGEGSMAYKSIHRTLRQVFPYTLVYSTKKGNEIGNIVIFTSNKEMKVTGNREYRNRAVEYWHGRMEEMRINGDLQQAIVLTDDYNPIEILSVKSSEQWRKKALRDFAEVLD